MVCVMQYGMISALKRQRIFMQVQVMENYSMATSERGSLCNGLNLFLFAAFWVEISETIHNLIIGGKYEN